jgi:hypothetical protein
MSSKEIPWAGTISEELESNGPISFTRRRLKKQEYLFAHRSALFYTPTENIPVGYVGRGPIDIRVPVTTPDCTSSREVRALMSPRLWVDLIQLQTGKLRWCPMSPAKVTFVRYDCFTIRFDHFAIGIKGVLDALKVRTTGRRNGINLYYFGAIEDDAPEFIDVSADQKLVANPQDSGLRIQVFPKKKERR